MRTVYNQGSITCLYNGVPLTDLAEGSSIIVTHDGGEVEKTHGTDGPGVNIATDQGGTCKISVKETSSSQGYLESVRMAQKIGAPGGTLVIRSGTDVIYMFGDAFVSVPGELSTGDKKMGSVQYTFASRRLVKGNDEASI